MEAELQPRLCHAGEPRARLHTVRIAGDVANPRLALARRRRTDFCQLALYADRHPAGQQALGDHACGGRERGHQNPDQEVGRSARGASRARARRRAGFSLGLELMPAGASTQAARYPDAMTSEPEILFDRRGCAGIVTLNRPQALNAVTLTMVRALRKQLDAWRDDPSVTRVVIVGAGGRAFSAGGDLRQVYDLGRTGRQSEALVYWRERYEPNWTIKRYPKPYVALLDGIVMGGGVGVSVHGSHRIAGDKFLFAMPEVAIGFFPDVGATWFLPRMPGELGTYCAVTGERLGPADGVAAGVATHRVPSARFPELLDGLCGADTVDDVIRQFTQPAEPGALLARRPTIDRAFAHDTVETILANLDNAAQMGGSQADWASTTA